MLKKSIFTTIILITLGGALMGCSDTPDIQTAGEPGVQSGLGGTQSEPSPTPMPKPIPVTYPASEANLYGNLQILGDGAVGQFEQKDDNDKLEFVINIPSEGFYRLEFEIRTIGGFKSNYIFINDAPAGEFTADSTEFSLTAINRVFLEEGENTVAVTAHWGWCAIMSLVVTAEAALDDSLFDIPATLVNPNADDNAKRLMNYLTDIYGTAFLSGQQSQGNWSRDHGLFGGEAKLVYEKTGKRPAVIGLDVIDYTLSRVARGRTSYETEAAIEAWDAGAIVTFCWHWNAPTPYINGQWDRAFYTEETQGGFFKKIMDGDDPEGYQLLLDDIDAIALQLTRLRDAGVPVLWRPLHEASGGWFWWGTDKDSYLKLYKLLYERLTVDHNLTNLIWVWNGQKADWYPGDEYVDIIGEDIYAPAYDYSSQSGKFFEAVGYTEAKKMIVLSENGVLFDPDLAARDGAWWGYWCVWNGEFARTEKHTKFDKLTEIYNHELVITHDELPDLKNYPLP